MRSTADGMLEYKSWLDDLAMEQRSQEVRAHPLLSKQSRSQDLSTSGQVWQERSGEWIVAV